MQEDFFYFNLIPPAQFAPMDEQQINKQYTRWRARAKFMTSQSNQRHQTLKKRRKKSKNLQIVTKHANNKRYYAWSIILMSILKGGGFTL
jgi:hypothetical protein